MHDDYIALKSFTHSAAFIWIPVHARHGPEFWEYKEKSENREDYYSGKKWEGSILDKETAHGKIWKIEHHLLCSPRQPQGLVWDHHSSVPPISEILTLHIGPLKTQPRVHLLQNNILASCSALDVPTAPRLNSRPALTCLRAETMSWLTLCATGKYLLKEWVTGWVNESEEKRMRWLTRPAGMLKM